MQNQWNYSVFLLSYFAELKNLLGFCPDELSSININIYLSSTYKFFFFLSGSNIYCEKTIKIQQFLKSF